jgi:hypothetical protein
MDSAGANSPTVPDGAPQVQVLSRDIGNLKNDRFNASWGFGFVIGDSDKKSKAGSRTSTSESRLDKPPSFEIVNLPADILYSVQTTVWSIK